MKRLQTQAEKGDTERKADAEISLKEIETKIQI